MNTDPAAAQVALNAALGRCGLEHTAINAVVMIGGIAHIAMLGILATSDIAHIHKVVWVTNHQLLGMLVDADEFTTATAFAQMALMTHTLEDDARKKKDQVAKMPEEVKEAVECKVFAKSLDTYLRLLKGTGKIPLKYVIHSDAVPDQLPL
jgi:hypothetical protein